MRIDAAELRSPPDRRSLRSLRPVTAAFGYYSVGTRYREATQPAEAALNIRRVPLLVILVVVLAHHAGMIMLAGK